MPLSTFQVFISKKKTKIDESLKLVLNHSVLSRTDTALNLGVVFNEDLSWKNHINTMVGRVQGMLRNLWAVQSCTPLHIRMLLAKTYLVPVLLYGCEIYGNCYSLDFAKLKTAFNNIARYIFQKRYSDRISSFSYKIFNMSFENLLKYKTLIFLQKIITSEEPDYLFERLQFCKSNRGKRIIQFRYKYSISERQFFINAIRLWNNLPNHIQTIGNAYKFKNEIKNLLM